ncbi:hypothetical protein BGX28_004971 [Mortierella sp. GBA30]|nr:hypothetical protein BGX28_004971 [Mortierella sp. GBA30]
MVHDDTYHVTTREHYHIQKRDDDALPSSYFSAPESDLVIYRDSDLYKRSASPSKRKRGMDESSCGTDAMLPNNPTADIFMTTMDDYYYTPNLTTTIPGSCEHLQGVAADCTYVRRYKGVAQARQQILANFNTASAIYESTFNVALGVIALNIVPEGCPAAPVKGEEWNRDCSTSYPIEQRLSDFSFWRGQGSRANDGAGLWHLMTECNTGVVVGIAWTKALCQMKTESQTSKGQQQFTAGTGVSSVSPNEWLIVAHEIGHGFGAIHDCNMQTCPIQGQCCPLSPTVCDAGAKYIMNPSESTPTKLFSPCSIKTICSTIKSSSGQCLKPPGTRQTQVSQPNICGNGIKETGEECDCGSPEDCAKDPCCDGPSCKLKGGAVCDDLNDECCQGCQLRPAGFVCRKAISECDIQEVCSGTNATCPADQRVPNLTPCKGTDNTTGLACANGICTSRDLQCQQQQRPGINRQCGASSTCDLICNDPGGSSMSCTQMPGTFFVDGSPCGIGGTCNNGACEYSNGVNGVLSWAKNHLSIVIPIASIFGLLLLCCLWSCCCGCVDRRRVEEQQYMGKPQRLNSNGYQYVDFAPPPGGPPPQQYAMVPLAPAPLPPAHQNSQYPAYTQHPNGSNYSANNPFGDHNAAQGQQQQRPQPSGYI